MNFFGVGPAELVLILVVALIFVGPERLPKLAADLARTIRDIRKYTGGLAAEFNEVVKEFEKETETDRTEWKEIGEGLSDAAKSVTGELESAQDDARGLPSPAATAAPPAPSANGSANGAGPGPTEQPATPPAGGERP